MPIKPNELASLTDDELLAKYSKAELRRFVEGERPGFLARLGAGFATTPEGEANIYLDMGYNVGLKDNQVVVNTPRGPALVDPKGLDAGDFADMAGEVPAIAGGVAGGLLGAAAGAPGGPVGMYVAGGAGAASGGATGELLRQAMAQAQGSQEQTSLGRVGVEAGLSALGEIPVGRILGKLLSGPAKRSTRAPDFLRTMEQLSEFDTRFGTSLTELAPIDVRSSSEALGQMVQRVRESPFGGEALRQQQDIPFQREMTSGFEALQRESGAAGPTATVGPYAERVGKGQAGRDLKGAATEAVQRRRERVGEAYKVFEAQVDPSQVPAMDNTAQALRDIAETNIFKRKKTGAQGLDDLRTAMDEAVEIQTFDDLVTLRQAVADEVDNWDPTRHSGGVQAQLKKLWGALKDDEAAFLEAGGRRSTSVNPPENVIQDVLPSQEARFAGQRARSLAREQFELDRTNVARRVFKDELKLSEIPDQLPRMNADEITALRRFVGAEGTEAGFKPTKTGRISWDQVAAEVLEDLKRAAKNTQKSTRDHFVISGERLQTALDKYKEGSLEAIFGAETAADLRNFADMARNVNVTERTFANWSRTAQAEQNILHMLGRFFTSPIVTAGEITGKILAQAGMGKLMASPRGKRYLLGELGVQEQYPRLLETIGRIVGQSAAQGLPRVQGAY